MISVSNGQDNESELFERLREIAHSQVLVGVPEETSTRPESDDPTKEIVTNAGLLYLHTDGSALLHIPARPVIEPAIEAEGNKGPIAEELALAAKAVLDGNPQLADKRLGRAGMLGQNAARAWFHDPRNGWPPNAPLTIFLKGSSSPLIDTGELRKSIVYVIRRRGDGSDD